jgi:hypothetical protein
MDRSGEWMNEWYLGSSPSRPDAPRPYNRPSVPYNLLLGYRNSVPVPMFQMTPILSWLISLATKKKKAGCACLSEAKVWHSYKTLTEVSSVPHFIQVGLLLSPILKLLYPVSRLIITLDCVLLKDNNRDLVASLGPEITSRACLCVLQGPRHITKRCTEPVHLRCNIRHALSLLLVFFNCVVLFWKTTKVWTWHGAGPGVVGRYSESI